MTQAELHSLEPGSRIRLQRQKDIALARLRFRVLNRPSLLSWLTARGRLRRRIYRGILEFDQVPPRAPNHAWLRPRHEPGIDRPGIIVHREDITPL